VRIQRTKITDGLIVLPNEKAIHEKMWSVNKGEAFVEGALAKSLSVYSGEAMSSLDFVRRLLCTINLVTQETSPESDLQMIMLSRVPRYINALVPEDVRKEVHARFERIKGSTYA
jgi:hypothetical protein